MARAIRRAKKRGDKEPPEVQEVQAAARQVLQDRHLGFHKTNVARGEKYALSGAQALSVELEGRQVKVFPLLELHWVGIALDFRYRSGGAVFDSVSVFVVKGLASQEKRPVLRAEWALGCEAEDPGHAQPHWHLYVPRGADRTGVERLSLPSAAKLDLDSAVSRAEEQAMWPISRFHLAMASRWDEGGGNGPMLTPAALGRWVGGCLRYTRHQLEYLAGKQGGQGLV